MYRFIQSRPVEPDCLTQQSLDPVALYRGKAAAAQEYAVAEIILRLPPDSYILSMYTTADRKKRFDFPALFQAEMARQFTSAYRQC